MKFNTIKAANWSIFIAFFFHFIFLFVFKNNSMIQDESRIVGDFFLEYFNTNSWVEKIKLIFFKENESYPGFIRFLYLLTYYVTGSIQFKWVLIIGNLLNLIPLYIIYNFFRDNKIDFIYFLPLPFLVFCLISYMTFSFSYVSFFYIGSSCIPLLCIYLLVYKTTNWVYYSFLLCLLLFTSTVLPTLFILIGLAVFTKLYKHSIFLFLLVLAYLFIIYFNNQSQNNQAYNQKILQDLIQNPIQIVALFMMTMGTWAKFFTENLSAFFVLGLVTFFVNMVSFVTTFRKGGISKKLIFYIGIFAFFYSLLFVNIVFRWNGNYEYQKNSIQDGSKIYFIIVLIMFVWVQFVELAKNFIHRNVWLSLISLIILNYFTTYYQSMGYAIVHYKSTLLSNVNRRFKNDHIFDRNQTNLDKLNLLVEKGYIKDESNIFTENYEMINKALANETQVNAGLDINQLPAQEGSLNMYGARPQPTKLYSYNTQPVGKFYNKIDGLYLIFKSEKDTAIFPVMFSQYIYWQLPLIRPKNIYDAQYFLTLNNAFGLDLPQNEYLIYFCFIENNKISKIELSSKKLVIENKKQVLKSL